MRGENQAEGLDDAVVERLGSYQRRAYERTIGNGRLVANLDSSVHSL